MLTIDRRKEKRILDYRNFLRKSFHKNFYNFIPDYRTRWTNSTGIRHRQTRARGLTRNADARTYTKIFV